jgi:hypothetical protein
MKRSVMCATAVIMVMLGLAVLPASVAALPSEDSGTRPENPGNPPNDNRDRPETVGFELNESVIFGEYYADGLIDGGIFVDGTTFPIGDYTNSWGVTSTMYSAVEMEPVYVEADWSDNLILHQFTTGSKIRTEVVLNCTENGATVFSIRASFSIVRVLPVYDDAGEFVEYVPAGTDPIIFSGNVSNGLWTDGIPENVYSAEVNQVGNLLYGHNWDEKTLDSGPGLYMLTFTLEPIADFEEWGLTEDSYTPPGEYYPYAGSDAGEIIITGVDDVKYSEDPSYMVKDIGFSDYSTWIVIDLVE